MIKVKLLTSTAKVPTKGSKYAAGLDLYADIQEELTIQPHTTEMIGTGIAVALPSGTFGGIYSRSGLGAKKGIRVAQGVGVIDEDYRGEVKVPLYNDSDIPYTIQPHDRIAQLICQKYMYNFIEVVDELDETERSDGGFNSSGR